MSLSKPGAPAPKEVWGPPRWRWLHNTAIEYPQRPTRAEAHTAFLHIWNFINQLPCKECRVHAIRYMMLHPPDLSSSRALQVWVWRFHNAVNYRLGKQEISYEGYQRLYVEELRRANRGAGAAVRGHRL